MATSASAGYKLLAHRVPAALNDLPTLVVNLNLSAPMGQLFRRLQNQLDIIKLLQTGVEVVHESQVGEIQSFMNFSPAHGAELSHDQARIEAKRWLQACFLRDAIEAAGLFLDECLLLCAMIKMKSEQGMRSFEIQKIVSELRRQHHKLHFPVKVKWLEKKYGVSSIWNQHVLSLNRVRACLVHRLGVVNDVDIGEDGFLTAYWRSTQLVAKGLESGKVDVIESPGYTTREETQMVLKFMDHTRSFANGERIELSSFELYSTIVTFWAFGVTCTRSVEAFARNAGLLEENVGS